MVNPMIIREKYNLNNDNDMQRIVTLQRSSLDGKWYILRQFNKTMT